MEKPIHQISVNPNVSIQAVADRVWIDDLLYISQYDGGATKYFEKTVDGTRYRGYLSKYKQAGFYQYYQGYLYREGIPYPIPSIVKPINL